VREKCERRWKRMIRRLTRRVEFFALLWSVGAIAFASIALKLPDVLGIAVGTALALANWFFFKWAGMRVAAVATKRRVWVFLAFKTASLLGLIWLILSSKVVSPLGLLLGVSSLVFGIFAHSSVQVLAEGDAALREER
jgi:hypothetical protein